jgi:hypothetical protein
MGANGRLWAIAAFRTLGGLSAWVAPNLLSRVYGGDPADASSLLWSRLAGSRELALAVGPLLSEGVDRTVWLRLGLACDLADMGATLIGGRKGALSPSTTRLSLATYTVSALLTGAALQSLKTGR